MHDPERRQSTRTTIEDFTYLSFGADSAGSVLNLSEGGLCFGSIAPIHHNGPVRLWFTDYHQRVEAEAEVCWTDKAHKTIGLRFTSLSAEDRQRIRQWNDREAHSADTSPEVAARVAAKAAVPIPVAVAAKPSHPASNPLVRLSVPVGLTPSGSAPILQPMPAPPPSSLKGFSRGLLTGVLLSAVFGGIVLFHSYRQEVGQWLIHLGQSFAAQPQPETRAAAPATANMALAQPAASPSQPTNLTQPASSPAAELSQKPSPLAAAPPPAAAPPTPPELLVVANHPAASPAPTNAFPEVTRPPDISFSSSGAVPAALAPDKPTMPQLKPADLPLTQPAVIQQTSQPAAVTQEETSSASTGPAPRMYFAVGKFKNPFGAKETTTRLAELGFPASVQQKNRLFSNSYVVLVGPYNNEADADAANKSLLSNDFTPQPVERGSRSMSFRSGVVVNGSNASGGNCEIRWESFVTEAVVKFVQDGSVVATSSGKWVPSDVRYPRDAILIRKNADGTRTLLEVRFGGMKRTLVLGKPS